MYERYGYLRSVILPNAHSEWNDLRLQDFKSVYEYNYALYRITSQLKLCGENIIDEDMLEKYVQNFMFLTWFYNNNIESVGIQFWLDCMPFCSRKE